MNLTITFAGLDSLVEAVNNLASAWRANVPFASASGHGVDVRSTTQRISPEDRPDAGRDVPLALMQPPATPADALPAWLGATVTAFTPPANLTGAAVVQPPLQLTAPGTAAVGLLPTAPAALPASTPVAPTIPVPPTPALPIAPAAVALSPTPAVPSAPAGNEVDARGMPWDMRIHASPGKKGEPKPRNKDGSWRQKRGTADTFVAEVEAQLRAAVVANAAVAVPAAPGVPLPPVVAALVPPSMPGGMPSAAPAGITFAQLALKFEQDFVSQRLTWEAVTPVLAKHGLQQFNQMIHAPHVVPLVDAELSALVGKAPGVPA